MGLCFGRVICYGFVGFRFVGVLLVFCLLYDCLLDCRVNSRFECRLLISVVTISSKLICFCLVTDACGVCLIELGGRLCWLCCIALLFNLGL